MDISSNSLTIKLLVLILVCNSTLSFSQVVWDGLDWEVGSGSTGIFSEWSSQSGENNRIIGESPVGSDAVLWRCGSDAGYNADGGWNVPISNSPIDPTKRYRYSVWVKRTNSHAGRTYHGTLRVRRLTDGGIQNNPYFFSNDLPELDTWYLMVGVVHPYDHSGGETGEGGLYDVNGQKVLDFTEFKWQDASIVNTRMRSSFHYSTNINTYQYFWYPRLEAIDASSPDVGDLINITLNGNGVYTSVEDAPALTTGWNQTSSIGFDFSGNPVTKSRSFYNSLGKGDQSQSWDVLTGQVWANQTLYDRHGRSVFQSLSAPVGNAFGYRNNFVLKTNGTEYTLADYDGTNTIDNPATVGNQTSTLGAYYSNGNTLDSYQDVTNYPFSKMLYSRLNPGNALEVFGGNKINGNWKQSYSFTMPAGTMTTSEPNAPQWYAFAKAIKTVSRDVHGNEVVLFNDTDGKALGAARVKSTNAASSITGSVTVNAGRQGYVDFHLSGGINTFNLTNNDPATYGNVEVYDLVSEQLLGTYSGSSQTVTLNGSGFYRASITQPWAFVSNGMSIAYDVAYYDYTHNEYDRVGRLLKSTQPLGDHLESTFSYNSLGQLLDTSSPDEGVAQFKYRKDGQIRFSQNDKQALAGEFSYTSYDQWGRPVESGVYVEGGGLVFASASSYWIETTNPLSATRTKEVHKTIYDIPTINTTALANCNIPVAEYQQTFVGGNVSQTITEDPSTNVSWYSYDVLGRLQWLVQQPTGMSCPVTINYEYHPATGQVLLIDYQRHHLTDRFIHKYEYNDGGQLVTVSTSIDGITYREQASYEYNETGALVRTVIAEDLQGIDYVYNLNGQLKAINHPSLQTTNDPGGDGGANGVKTDLFGMAIDYYNGDYTRAATPTPVAQQNTHGTDQFNGNIKGIRFNTENPQGGNFDTYMYQYNTNNWLNQAVFGTGSISAISGNKHQVNYTSDPNDDYSVKDIAYDANGNIKNLRRKGYTDASGDNPMDDLEYKYLEDGNRLAAVNDTDDNSDPNRYNDIRDQYDVDSGVLQNYYYNDIGQLVTNAQEGITYEYNASGLVTRINAFGDNTTGEMATLLYHNFTDFDNSTAAMVQFGGSGHSSSVNADWNIDNSSGQSTHCGNLASTYGNTLQLDFSTNREKIATIPLIAVSGAEHTIDLDVLFHQTLVFGSVNDSAIIRIRDNGSGLGATLAETTLTSGAYGSGWSYNSSNPCANIFEKNASFTFTPNNDQIRIEIEASSGVNNSNAMRLDIDHIHLQAATTPLVAFAYDDRGQRIRKDGFNQTVVDGTKPVSGTVSTYYLRDVSGNVISIYSGFNTGAPEQTENPVYGNSRLGIYKKDQQNAAAEGDYLYQLTDHLGNVRAVVSKDQSGNAIAIAKTDYYPFGMPMPNRNVEADYRYAYQGQEKDQETGKEAFESRLWNSKTGRWETIDPAGQFFSPYLGMGNNPINAIDQNGEWIKYIVTQGANGDYTINVTVGGKIINLSDKSTGSIYAKITSQLKRLHTIFNNKSTYAFDKNGIKRKVKLNIKFQYNWIDNVGQIEDDDHVLAIINSGRYTTNTGHLRKAGGFAELGGRFATVQSDRIRAIPHEIAHNLGIEDLYDAPHLKSITPNWDSNLMVSSVMTGLLDWQLFSFNGLINDAGAGLKTIPSLDGSDYGNLRDFLDQPGVDYKDPDWQKYD